jgi:alpha-L-fucosidase 2
VTKGGVLSVAGADEVLLLIAAATSYRRFDDVGGDPCRDQGHPGQGLGQAWPALLADHQADHRALFRRVASTSEPRRRR